MNYDVTLLAKASQPVACPLPPDVERLADHRGAPKARQVRLRTSVSAWLYRLAARIDPRPADTENDTLFEAIAAMLAEPVCEGPGLKTASQRGC